MRTALLATVAAAALIFAPGAARAVSYTYVGSWNVANGPTWFNNPPVYSGQSAAALLFGGSASDYAISTVDSNPADINFSAWLDGWADGFTYARSGSPAPQSYSLDSTGLGYDGCVRVGSNCYQSAYSAYVSDHLSTADGFVNYAFRIEGVPVPEPMTASLLGMGVLALAVMRRRNT